MRTNPHLLRVVAQILNAMDRKDDELVQKYRLHAITEIQIRTGLSDQKCHDTLTKILSYFMIL